MCNIWKQKPSVDLSPEEIATIFSNKLFSELKTIGITGGEPTLRHDLSDVIKAIVNNTPKLNVVGLTTNGLNTKQVIDQVKKASELCFGAGVKFTVSVSLDGLNEIHDKTRGVPESFEKTVKTLCELKKLKESNCITDYSIGCTIGKVNCSSVKQLDAWGKAQGIPIKFRLATAINRIHNQETSKEYEIVDENEKLSLSNFFAEKHADSKLPLSERMHYKYVSKILKGELIFRKPCIAGENGLLLDSNGDTYICSVHSAKIGNALTENPFELYNCKKTIKYRNWLKKNECPTCKHDYGCRPSIVDRVRFQILGW